jgi:hypothetical protein
VNALPRFHSPHRRPPCCAVHSLAEIYRPVFDPGEPSSTAYAVVIGLVALIAILFAAAHFSSDRHDHQSSNSTIPPPPPQTRSSTSIHLVNFAAQAAL